MPIHDWTRVPAGTWHDFHHVWIAEVRTALNDGLLPERYYAQAEQIAGPFGPDVLTLQEADPPRGPSPSAGDGTATMAPPRLRSTAQAEVDDYVLKRRTIVVRHVSDDRIIALLEIVSPGNKSSRHALDSFVEKAVEALYRGYHLLIVDLFPPSPRRAPQGIHAAIWGEFTDDESYALPPGEPLTLATYSAGRTKRAFIEPTAVGRDLIDMPLFLTEDHYVNVPLEACYRGAWRGVPRRWKTVLEATPA